MKRKPRKKSLSPYLESAASIAMEIIVTINAVMMYVPRNKEKRRSLDKGSRTVWVAMFSASVFI